MESLKIPESRTPFYLVSDASVLCQLAKLARIIDNMLELSGIWDD